jgi:hypothetical protein
VKARMTGPQDAWPSPPRRAASPPPRAGRAAVPALAVRDLLAVHAATRERTADHHMFTVNSWSGQLMGTFRLQLFTAPGARPVAVATQLPLEGGSLANGAEDYAADVWRQKFPGSAESPIWITLQLHPGGPAEGPERFSLVTFRVAGPYELSSPAGRFRGRLMVRLAVSRQQGDLVGERREPDGFRIRVGKVQGRRDRAS